MKPPPAVSWTQTLARMIVGLERPTRGRILVGGDEAVASLDVSIQAQVLNLLSDIRESTGVTYLFISHDLAVVRQVSDDVMVMRSGRVVEAGPTDQVLSSPQAPYTKRLLNAIPRAGV